MALPGTKIGTRVLHFKCDDLEKAFQKSPKKDPNVSFMNPKIRFVRTSPSSGHFCLKQGDQIGRIFANWVIVFFG
jgi:hypothetical protein